jgi:hypothetical protein
MADDQQPGQKRGCFKTGCFGCLGLGACMLVGIVFLLVMAKINSGTKARVEDRHYEQQLPFIDRDSERVTSAASEHGPFRLAPADVAVREPGRIVFDIAMADFSIEPGPAGEPLRVEAQYDSARYELLETLESYGEVGWTYRLSFDSKSWLKMIGINNSEHIRVRLIVPRDSPLSIEGTTGIGKSELELGGLWLIDVDLETKLGEHRVSFSEPLAGPMNSFKMKSGMGELSIDQLGNASPLTVALDHNIGEISVGLLGPWMRDADIDIDVGLGGCSVLVPDNVALDLETSIMIGEQRTPGMTDLPDLAEDAPTLHITGSQSIGELSIRR